MEFVRNYKLGKVEFPSKNIAGIRLVERNFYITLNNSKTDQVISIEDCKNASELYKIVSSRYNIAANLPPETLINSEISTWEQIRENLSTVKFPNNTTFLKVGEVSNILYQIITGECIVTSFDSSGEILYEKKIGPGSFIGQYAFLFGQYCIYSCTSSTPVTLVCVKHDDIEPYSKMMVKEFSSMFALIADSIARHIISRQFRLSLAADKGDFAFVKQPRIAATNSGSPKPE